MKSEPVKDMLALLCSTFRCQIDSYQKRAYVRALSDVPGDVLLAAADALINESAAGRKFYPMPTAPDVKGACAKEIRKRRAAIVAQMPSCEQCHGSRWKNITVDGVDYVTRCDCFLALQKAIDAVGKPLALPAVGKVEDHGDGYDGKMRAIGGRE